MDKNQFIKNFNQVLRDLLNEINEWADEHQDFNNIYNNYYNEINKLKNNNNIIDLLKRLTDLHINMENKLNNNNGHIFYINIYYCTSILINNLKLLINNDVKL